MEDWGRKESGEERKAGWMEKSVMWHMESTLMIIGQKVSSQTHHIKHTQGL